MMGANEVLVSCEGWLMVSQSKTTNWRLLANSKILSISPCTSAENRFRKLIQNLHINILNIKNIFNINIKNENINAIQPMDEDLLLVLSMRALLLGLFKMDLLAREISAVTLVMTILKWI